MPALVEPEAAAHRPDPESARQMLAQLVDLTRDMVEKTRVAEAQLRQQSQAMDQDNAGPKTGRETRPRAQSSLRNRLEFERELGAAAERARASGESVSLAFCNVFQKNPGAFVSTFYFIFHSYNVLAHFPSGIISVTFFSAHFINLEAGMLG